MADELKTAAAGLVKALTATSKALETYLAVATKVGSEAADGASYRGLDGRQVRRRLKAEVIARLSPKPVHGMPDPPLQLEGAPEARRYVTAHPLPGLV